MMGRTIFSIVIFCFLVISCKSDTKEESTSAIQQKIFQLQNQGWKSKTVSHFVGDITYSATEVPKEYYFLKQGLSLDSISKLSSQFSKERIIEVEFEHVNEVDLLLKEFTKLDYEKSVMYMSSGIQNDFFVVTQGKDTIPSIGVHFERHYKVSPFQRVLIYFTGVPENAPIQLIYRDRLFNNGNFKFKFEDVPLKL
tara:strand:+ start:1690 stop:2277 length:588 start_codon:yes stop_codon:yes gene_type:complete